MQTDNSTLQQPPAEQARRILRRIEFQYSLKHASWLNMVEIGVLLHQCLSCPIPGRETLEAKIAKWEQQRNDSQARINWMFTAEKAIAKMANAYPKPMLLILNSESQSHCNKTL